MLIPVEGKRYVLIAPSGQVFANAVCADCIDLSPNYSATFDLNDTYAGPNKFEHRLVMFTEDGEWFFQGELFRIIDDSEGAPDSMGAGDEIGG